MFSRIVNQRKTKKMMKPILLLIALCAVSGALPVMVTTGGPVKNDKNSAPQSDDMSNFAEQLLKLKPREQLLFKVLYHSAVNTMPDSKLTYLLNQIAQKANLSAAINDSDVLEFTWSSEENGTFPSKQKEPTVSLRATTNSQQPRTTAEPPHSTAEPQQATAQKLLQLTTESVIHQTSPSQLDDLIMGKLDELKLLLQKRSMVVPAM